MFNSTAAPIVSLLNQLMGPLLSIVGAVGTLYCVVLGVKFAHASEPQEREKAKEALKNAVVGFLLIFVLILSLNLLMPVMVRWANAQAEGTVIDESTIGTISGRNTTPNQPVTAKPAPPEETPAPPEETPAPPQETPETPEETPAPPQETPETPEETPAPRTHTDVERYELAHQTGGFMRNLIRAKADEAGGADRLSDEDAAFIRENYLMDRTLTLDDVCAIVGLICDPNGLDNNVLF